MTVSRRVRLAIQLSPIILVGFACLAAALTQTKMLEMLAWLNTSLIFFGIVILLAKYRSLRLWSGFTTPEDHLIQEIGLLIDGFNSKYKRGEIEPYEVEKSYLFRANHRLYAAVSVSEGSTSSLESQNGMLLLAFTKKIRFDSQDKPLPRWGVVCSNVFCSQEEVIEFVDREYAGPNEA